MTVVQVSYFSDVLCIWAYATQARIVAVKEKFGDTVRLDYRFCSVFGDTARKITSTWKDKGEYAGFNAHLRTVAPAAALIRITSGDEYETPCSGIRHTPPTWTALLSQRVSRKLRPLVRL